MARPIPALNGSAPRSPFEGHPAQGIIHVNVLREVGNGNPRQRKRFITEAENLAAVCAHDEPHIVMPVLRRIGARWNAMPVQVENVALADQITQTGLLFRLARGHPGQIGIAIGVPPQLQPATQLPMMGQQNALPIGANQPGGAREMSGRMVALKNVPGGNKKLPKIFRNLSLVAECFAIAPQRILQ